MQMGLGGESSGKLVDSAERVVELPEIAVASMAMAADMVSHNPNLVDLNGGAGTTYWPIKYESGCWSSWETICISIISQSRSKLP